MIQIQGLTQRFGRFVALRDVSLEVRTGEVIALWGPNGAGKSTLVRCLLGLLPFEGRATIAGLDVRRQGKAVRRLIGYVPQEPALFDDMRVDEAALFFGRLKRAEPAEVRRMLDEVHLVPHAQKRVRELSGGLKQRLALGLARLTDPPVILMDEPTASLDAATRGEVLADVARLRERGKTVLLISHRPEEVRQLADRIVTLEAGRVVDVEVTGLGTQSPKDAEVTAPGAEVPEGVEVTPPRAASAAHAAGSREDVLPMKLEVAL
jgi:ABC-2 type transport system ATP-binding protein